MPKSEEIYETLANQCQQQDVDLRSIEPFPDEVVTASVDIDYRAALAVAREESNDIDWETYL